VKSILELGLGRQWLRGVAPELYVRFHTGAK
jgi:hypothetical protein